MQKITPREIQEEQKDYRYECFRAFKTLLVIMVVFSIALILQKQYFSMINNSRFLKFYPENTLFYMDFKDGTNFQKVKLPNKYEKLSYGIFKDNRGNEKFLIVAETDEEDTPIIDKKRYSQFTKHNTIFISDSAAELENLQDRLKHHKHPFLTNSAIKKSLKKLDKQRTNTIIINDAHYINLPVSNEVVAVLNKIFANAIIQTFEDNNKINFYGEINFKNDIAGFITNIKQLSNCLTNRQIKISNFKSDEVAMIIGVKDFDLWTKSLLAITNNIPNNQYTDTLKLIENGFNSNVEEDIVKNFDGNAVFYLFKQKREMHPLLYIEAKSDLDKQVQKYFTFLQLPNNLKLTEKEINQKTLNVLNSKFYPYNLVFGTFDNNVFLSGHQHIVEQYLEYDNNKFKNKNNDFYFYSNIKNTPALNKKRYFTSNYKDIEVEIFLSPNLNFTGSLSKKE